MCAFFAHRGQAHKNGHGTEQTVYVSAPYPQFDVPWPYFNPLPKRVVLDLSKLTHSVIYHKNGPNEEVCCAKQKEHAGEYESEGP